MNSKTDLYDILEVDRNAVDADIKKAYKKLAVKWHPDKCQDENRKLEYENNFKKISQAYDILIDSKKREIYDETKSVDNIDDILKQKEMFSGFPFGGMMGGMPGMPGMSGFPFGGFHNMQSNTVRFNPDIVCSVRLTLEEIYNGKTIKQPISRQIIKLANNTQDKQTENEEVDIPIKQGIATGQKIVLRGKGNKLFRDDKLIKIGNIIVTIDEIAHPSFKRSPLQPLHIYMNQKISVFQALLGEFDFVTSGLNKEKIILSMGTNIIKPGTVLCIKNKGMVVQNHNGSNTCGNLYVIFDIEFPNELNDSQRSSLKIMTDYVSTKKKKVNDVAWSFTSTDELEKLLNTNDRDDNNDAEENQYMGSGPNQSVQCAQQ
jgi:DnaJ-class molecular chaperone